MQCSVEHKTWDARRVCQSRRTLVERGLLGRCVQRDLHECTSLQVDELQIPWCWVIRVRRPDSARGRNRTFVRHPQPASRPQTSLGPAALPLLKRSTARWLPLLRVLWLPGAHGAQGALLPWGSDERCFSADVVSKGAHRRGAPRRRERATPARAAARGQLRGAAARRAPSWCWAWRARRTAKLLPQAWRARRTAKLCQSFAAAPSRHGGLYTEIPFSASDLIERNLACRLCLLYGY